MRARGLFGRQKTPGAGACTLGIKAVSHVSIVNMHLHFLTTRDNACGERARFLINPRPSVEE